jgi:hypothetical protein
MDFISIPNPTSLINLLCPHQSRDRMHRMVSKFNREDLRTMNDFIDAIIYIGAKFNSKDKDMDFSKFKEIYDKINKNDGDIIVKEVLTEI